MSAPGAGLGLFEVDAGYGASRVLHAVTLEVRAGEVVGLLGRNGAGKTTTLRAVMGLTPPRAGRITLGEVELNRLPAWAIPRHGVAYVPQGRRLFPQLSVEENLRLGLLVRGGGAETLEPVLALFPAVRERLRQRAGTLSGGEQQMVAMARALCARPAMLLLDEPAEGLMPALVDRLVETVAALRGRGVGILLVEQKVDVVLRAADRVVFLDSGRVAGEAPVGAVGPELLLRHVGVRR
jgi:branched-chain amino acid transport system ATP-binding protein